MDSSTQPGDGALSTWVVDKVENGMASVEIDGNVMLSVPVGILPEGVREGDVLRAAIAHDPAERARRLSQSAAQVARGGTGGRGDIKL